MSGVSAHYHTTKNRGASNSLAWLYFLSILNCEPMSICAHLRNNIFICFTMATSSSWNRCCSSLLLLGCHLIFSICILLLAMGSALEEIQHLDDLLLYFSIVRSAMYHLKLFFSCRLPLYLNCPAWLKCLVKINIVLKGLHMLFTKRLQIWSLWCRFSNSSLR